MDKMYFLLLGIALLAFFISIFLLTKGKYASSEVGSAPVVQLMFVIPIFVISSLIYFITKNINFVGSKKWIYLLLPLILELGYFIFTKDVFSVFKSDAGGFIIRSYVFSVILATILMFLVFFIV